MSVAAELALAATLALLAACGPRHYVAEVGEGGRVQIDRFIVEGPAKLEVRYAGDDAEAAVTAVP